MYLSNSENVKKPVASEEILGRWWSEHKFLTSSLAQLPPGGNTRTKQTCWGRSLWGPKSSWALQGKKAREGYTLSSEGRSRELMAGKTRFFLQPGAKTYLCFTAFWGAQTMEDTGLQWWTEKKLPVPAAGKGLSHTTRETTSREFSLPACVIPSC